MRQPATTPRWGEPEPAWVLLGPVVRALTHAWFDLRAVGLERIPRRGPCLVVTNHLDHLDPIMILVSLLETRGRRVRFLALADLFDLPLTGWWLRRARAVPVQRGSGVEPMIKEARTALDVGEVVVVYPEGRLPRRPGRRATARRGAGALARAAGDVPIVPLAHWGLQPVDDRDRHPAVRTLIRGPGSPVGLAAGRPLRSRDLGGSDEGAAAALLGIIRAQLEPVARQLTAIGRRPGAGQRR